MYGKKVEGKKIGINNTMKSSTCKSDTIFPIDKFDRIRKPTLVFRFFFLRHKQSEKINGIRVRRKMSNNCFVIL